MRLGGLRGDQAFIDHSYLHFSGFADTRQGIWDEGLLRCFQLDPAKLPRIVPPQEVIGQVNAEASARTGLRAGTAILAGCGDTAASFLACGATRENICVDVAGTASVFAATTRAFFPDTKTGAISCGRSAVPGLWHPYAYIAGGGLNLEWFKDNFAQRPLEELNDAAAALEPALDDPYFLPHLGGRACPAQPALRGTWAGLGWNHGQAHLYRAILEGVALEYGIYRGILQGIDPAFHIAEVRITGGGERSAVWNQMKADVLGCPVIQVSGGGGAPMGSALLAAFGVGLVDDLDSAALTWVQRGGVTSPQPARRGHYQSRQVRYHDLLHILQQWHSQA